MDPTCHMVGVSLGLIALRMAIMDGTCMAEVVLYLSKVGLQLVEVVKESFTIGLAQRRIKLLGAIGLQSCTVNLLIKIGHGCMEHLLTKVGLPCMEITLIELGPLCSMVNVLIKLGLSLSTVNFLTKIGLSWSTEINLDELGLLAWMLELMDYLTLVHELLAAFQVMVWGEVESEMDRTGSMVLGLREVQ